MSVWINDDAGSGVQATEARLIAQDIARSLKEKVRRDGKLLKPSDFAILLATRTHSGEFIDALCDAGLRAQFTSKETIYETDAARELYIVLKALEQPKQRKRLASACATRLIGKALPQILDDDGLVEARLLLEDTRGRWERSGPAAALAWLMAQCGTARRILAQAGGTTDMSVLDMLTARLHAQWASSRSITGAISWLELRMQGGALSDDEEDTVPAAPDDNAVRIMTIHASKGLQFPVVYLPQIGSSHSGCHNDQSLFRETLDDGSVVLSLPVKPVSVRPRGGIAWDRQEEEYIRLAYVAMTRAASRLVVLCLKNADNGLLHGLAGDLVEGAPAKGDYKRVLDAILARMQAPDPRDASRGSAFDRIRETLRDTSLTDEDLLEIKEIDLKAEGGCEDTAPAAALRPLAPAAAPGYVRSAFARSSFSSLARRLPEAPPAEPLQPPPEGAVAFPSGMAAGTWLHEQIEGFVKRGLREPGPREPDPLQRSLAGASFMAGADEESLRRCCEWTRGMIDGTLNRPLMVPAFAKPLVVGRLAKEARSPEMQFMFEIRNKGLDTAGLARLLKIPGNPLMEGGFAGFLTGVIDLAFYHDGKFWVIDWKSNYLGDGTAASYTPQAMQESVDQHRYKLQYMIYLVALKRWIKALMPELCDDACWERIGGAVYVFLRARGPGCPPEAGLFYDYPLDEVKRLDAMLEGASHGN
ncbi:MAG: hypothetical protein HUK26_08070 [Duodenibacillus sp.]|nr:hypothetical protein [Duodenibacillus sp.]